MKMDHETKKLIDAALLSDELSCFNEDLLVDVFCVWDCFAQDWIADSPVLLRFETDDVLIHGNIGGNLTFEVGPIDTSDFPAFRGFGDTEGSCLYWLNVRKRWYSIAFG